MSLLGRLERSPRQLYLPSFDTALPNVPVGTIAVEMINDSSFRITLSSIPSGVTQSHIKVRKVGGANSTEVDTTPSETTVSVGSTLAATLDLSGAEFADNQDIEIDVEYGNGTVRSASTTTKTFTIDTTPSGGFGGGGAAVGGAPAFVSSATAFSAPAADSTTSVGYGGSTSDPLHPSQGAVNLAGTHAILGSGTQIRDLRDNSIVGGVNGALAMCWSAKTAGTIWRGTSDGLYKITNYAGGAGTRVISASGAGYNEFRVGTTEGRFVDFDDKRAAIMARSGSNVYIIIADLDTNTILPGRYLLNSSSNMDYDFHTITPLGDGVFVDSNSGGNSAGGDWICIPVNSSGTTITSGANQTNVDFTNHAFAATRDGAGVLIDLTGRVFNLNGQLVDDISTQGGVEVMNGAQQAGVLLTDPTVFISTGGSKSSSPKYTALVRTDGSEYAPIMSNTGGTSFGINGGEVFANAGTDGTTFRVVYANNDTSLSQKVFT